MSNFDDFSKEYNVGDVISMNYIVNSDSNHPLGIVIGKITEIELGPVKNEWSIYGKIIDDHNIPSNQGHCNIEALIDLETKIFFIYNEYFDKFLIKNLSAPLRLASKKLAFVSGVHERLGNGSLLECLPTEIIRQICESLNVLSERLPARGGGKSKRKKKSKKRKRRSKKKKTRKRKSKRRR